MLILSRVSGAQKLQNLPRTQPPVLAVLDELIDEELKGTSNDDRICGFESERPVRKMVDNRWRSFTVAFDKIALDTVVCQIWAKRF